MLDKTIEPYAISRIFEKVNRTGLTLGPFDLMVAKTFDPGWNLRDKWTEALEQFPELSSFLGQDGMPLLQAIALIEVSDLRQSAVLGLSKEKVQANWETVVYATAQAVSFLRDSCGVLRREMMPYANLLAPLIALEAEGRLSEDPDMFRRWFWYSGFAGSYDAAANTRLVAHYRDVRDGKTSGFELAEPRIVKFATATKKSQRALWNAVLCANIVWIESQVGRLSPALAEELEPSSLFSIDEVLEVVQADDPDYAPDTEFRSVLNAFLVPRRLASIVRKTGALASLAAVEETEFAPYARAQVAENIKQGRVDWDTYRAAQGAWLTDFIRKEGVTNVKVVTPAQGIAHSHEVEL
jgi:hypothetical protein